MTYLLDTHVWLWMVTAPERLGATTRAIVGDVGHRLVLSAASSWEIAIKHALGRLPLPQPVDVFVAERMVSTGVEGLAIEHAHTWRVGTLAPHHRDPFDRLLVAQAQVEKLPIITADTVFDRYGIEVLQARQ